MSALCEVLQDHVHQMFSRFLKPRFTRPTNLLNKIAHFSSRLQLWTNKKCQRPPRPMWLIKEEELEESFIKGGGPGGQKINKCNSKVQLKHIPTGIVVDSQYLRLQNKNRKRSREILAMKLEQIQDPDNCRLKFIEDEKKRVKANRKKKALKNQRKRKMSADGKAAKQAAIEDERKRSKRVEMTDVEGELDALIICYTKKSEELKQHQ